LGAAFQQHFDTRLSDKSQLAHFFGALAPVSRIFKQRHSGSLSKGVMRDRLR
jgi:hypothetical protein